MPDLYVKSGREIDSRLAFRTGLFVVVTLGLLVNLMLGIGCDGARFFKRTKQFSIFFERADGLKKGGMVTIAGVQVGRIVEIEAPAPRSERPAVPAGWKGPLEVRVVVEVKQSARLYRETKVEVTKFGVLSDAIVDFTQGNEESGLAEPGWKFVGSFNKAATDSISTALDTFAKQLSELKPKLEANPPR